MCNFFKLIFLTIFIGGCSHTSPYKNLAGYPDYNGLSRYEDKDVVCYLFIKDDYPALWCKDKK